MRTIEPAETLKLPASSREIGRRWVVRFAELFGRELTSAMVELWTDALSDLPPDVLESACRQVARTARFFPAPGEIRAAIDQSNAAGLELEAEEAWQEALDHARRWCGDRRPPRLPPKIEQAVRAAGGLIWIESCPQKELQWARRQFVDGFKRTDELDRAGHLLTRREARRILAAIGADAGRPALPVPNAAAEGEPVEEIGLAGVCEIFSRHLPSGAPPPARKPQTECDPVIRDDRRVAEQKARLAEWMAKRKAS